MKGSKSKEIAMMNTHSHATQKETTHGIFLDFSAYNTTRIGNMRFPEMLLNSNSHQPQQQEQ